MILVETALVALCSYRLWRLLAVDDLTERVRSRLAARVAHVLACPWCAGWWSTVAVGAAAHLAGLTDGTPWLIIPAASVIVGYLGDNL